MKKTILSILFGLLVIATTSAQKTIKGVVQETKKFEPIPLANVYWLGTTQGVVADDDGNFKIQEPSSYPARLIASFVGYKADTILFEKHRTNITFTLKSDVALDEFKVTEKQASTYVNTIDPLHVETITSKELAKAACCNISESFETNASVDVHFKDAVSGRKTIEMLGLDGIYTQIQGENLPLVRGLSAAYGLTFIPGTWAESIQVKKGAGSVINGYESITGQINIEFQKPDEAEQLYVNGYLNAMSRAEINVHAAQKVSDRWSTMSFLHVNNQQIEHDLNNDNFHDHPLREQYNFFNRWKYIGKKHMFQGGFRGVYEKLRAGQVEANPLEPLYYIGVESKQFEVFTKNGFLFPEKPYKSIGVLNTLRFHTHDSKYGPKTYDAQQISGYLNVIYQTIILDTDHQIKMGGSLVYDNFDKNLNESFKFGRVETVPGIFAEITNHINEKNIIVAGVRSDYHNTYGTFVSPRLHYKFNFTDQSAFRLSAGRGFRTAHPILESGAAMASVRTILLDRDLEPEVAWNYGTSLNHGFKLLGKNMTTGVDYYFTNFNNQIVADIENPREVAFYNLKGQSYSHSLQGELSVDINEFFDFKVAYKWYNIKTQYRDGFKSKPLIPTNRILVNLSYTTNFDIWKFNLTAKWFGTSRLPSTASNLPENQMSNTSEAYYLLNGQITKAFKHFELYSGVENLLNYRQSNPIIATNDPNGSNFDASMIWGPVVGRNIYIGFRYKLK